MIPKNALRSLNLKPYTMSGCNDLYIEIFSQQKDMTALEQKILSLKNDPNQLNKYWWVLNYHSGKIDKSRRLRAIVESQLERIAKSNACYVNDPSQSQDKMRRVNIRQ